MGLVALPVVVWFLLQWFLYRRSGIQIPADAIFRYIPYAQEIAQNFHYDLGQDIRYAGYTSVMALFMKAGLPFGYLVGFQVLLSLVALFLVQRMVVVLTNSRLCAFAAALLAASSQDIQQWNFYLLTESLFTSTLVCCVAVLVLCKTRKMRLLSLPLWLFLCLVRPNGFIAVAAAAVYYLAEYLERASPQDRRRMFWAVGGVGVLFLLLLNQLLGPFTLVETYARGEIIYGTAYSSLTPPGSTMYRLVPPSTLQMPPADAPAVEKLALFFWYNPVYFLKLAFVKGAVFLAFAKPYFSKAHNVFIFFTVYPCYLLSGWALRRKRNAPAILAFFTIIGLQTLMVMFTVEDWDCRFMAPILPFIFMLAAVGVKQIWGHRLPAWDKIHPKID
ncbi:hypothetical protein EFA69_12230 [Rufibacter immobilis]|uniref:Glycosyltransferase RgtA/B/C/D-like domain-containing protein n=2 Tax=Rufibacter immobilis TaxID=1348778 RepID=A0A3M9MXJ5_9BACT|nr:hypothetical protein EFA69_12230 [Rufibacter immobilis]